MDFHHAFLEMEDVGEEIDLCSQGDLQDWETYLAVVTDLDEGNYLVDT